MASLFKTPGSISAGNKATSADTVQLKGGQEDVRSPASNQNIAGAFGNASRASDAMTALSTSITTDLINQRSEELGKQRGHEEPGADLIPAITQADKHYVNAYHQEEYNNLAFNGQKFLQDSAQIVHQDPTTKNLLTYQQKAQQQISSLVNNSTDHNRYNLERTLIGAYENQFLQLSNAVEAKNKQILKDNFNAFFTQGLETQYNSGSTGQFEELNHNTDMLLKANENAKNAGTVTQSEYQENLKKAKLMKTISSQMYGLMQAEKKGEGDKYLSEFADTATPGLTPFEKESATTELFKHLNSYRSLKAGQQQVNYTHAIMAVDAGTLDPTSIEKLRTDLSPRQFADVEHHYQTKQLELIDGQLAQIDLVRDADNAEVLAQMSPERFKKAFLKQVGDSNFSEDPIQNMAFTAAPIRRKNPVVSNMLEQTLTYGNPEQALSAASAVTYLRNQNGGVSIQDMDKKARSIGVLYQLYATDNTHTPAENLERAREQVLKQDPQTQQTRLDAIQAKLQKGGVSTASIKTTLNKELKEKGWFKGNSVIPDAATADYMDALLSYAMNGLEYNDAKANAIDDVASAYPETHINGVAERMKYANMMPFGDDVVKNRESINKSLQYMAGVNSQYKRDGVSVLQSLEYVPATGKMKVNGVEREIKVKADYFTDIKQGKAWALYYVNEQGLQVNIVDPKAPDGIARWIPSQKRQEVTSDVANQDRELPPLPPMKGEK